MRTETQTTHTPAPWTWSPATLCHGDRIAGSSPEVSGPLGDAIAKVWHSKNAEANARLIAQAPNLLEACEDMYNAFIGMRAKLDVIDDRDKLLAIESASRAIAHATRGGQEC